MIFRKKNSPKAEVDMNELEKRLRKAKKEVNKITLVDDFVCGSMDKLSGFPRSWKMLENPGKNCCHGKSWKSLGI